jgi:hypothetical protein
MLNTCHIDDVRYVEDPESTHPGRGAVIVLPACECGARAHLKADYRLKELYRAVIAFENDQGICHLSAKKVLTHSR